MELGRHPDMLRTQRNGFGVLCGVPTLGLGLPVGAVMGGALALSPKRFRRGDARRELPKTARTLFQLALVSLLGLGVSSLWNGGLPPRATVLSVVGFAVALVAATRLAHTPRAAADVVALAAVATCASQFIVGDEMTQLGLTGLWKYGLGTSTAFGVAYLLDRRAPSLGRPVLAAVGLLSLFLDFRSLALVAFATVVALTAKHGGRRRGLKVVAAVALVLVAVTYLPGMIERGTFGQAVASKTVAQAESAGGLSILAGRLEPPLSMAAIAERPLLGWGNPVGINNSDTIAAGLSLARDLGMQQQTAHLRSLWVVEDGQVSLHSILLGDFATGGILSALLPFALLVLFASAAVRLAGEFSILLTLVAVQGCWDLLFSPWADNRGVVMALGAVLILRTSEAAKRPEAPSPATTPGSPSPSTSQASRR